MDREKKKIEPKELVLPCLLSVLLIALLVLSPFLDGRVAGENPEAKTADFDGFFNTVCRISDYSGMSEGEFSELSELVESELDFYHRLFDIYHSYAGVTNIKDINDSAGDSVTVSPELFAFLEYAKEMYTLTGGEVNIAMGAVLSIWHDFREEGVSLPDSELLRDAALHTDIDSLVLDKEALTVTLTDSEMSLDVGALAKGYAAERIAEKLKSLGYESLVLDLGGNIRAVGRKPDGTGWKTGVRNPDTSSGGYLYEFILSDAAAVTSGNYERYYTVDGKRYHHIIDKDTLMPSEHFVSVTVISDDSALADALSTALFNMTEEEGEALVEGLGNVKVVWLKPDGEVKISE